jgi:hypothetical protein
MFGDIMDLDKALANAETLDKEIIPSVVRLKNISLLDVETISIGHDTFNLTEKASKSFHKILEVPFTFSRSLKNKYSDTWQQLIDALRNKKELDVALAIDYSGRNGVSGLIRNVYTPNSHPISFSDFVKIAEKVANESHRSVTFDMTREFQFATFGNNDSDKFAIDGSEVFFRNVSVYNSPIMLDSAVVYSSIERIVCSNLMLLSNVRKFYHRIVPISAEPGRLLEASLYSSILSRSDINNYTRERYEIMKKYNASLMELNFAYNVLKKYYAEDDQNLQNIWNKLSQTISEFKLSYPIKKKSVKWLSSAESSFKYWDLYNDMTYLNSHSKMSNFSYSPMEVPVFISSYFSKNPDLVDIAPSRGKLYEQN